MPNQTNTPFDQAFYHTAKFILSAAALKQLPEDKGFEVAFAGRSNAGKSTCINTLTQQKNLAKTSKTPGRTQLINLFRLDDDRRLIDLPGYGYAKVPMAVKNRWQKTLGQYLQTRKCLKGVVILMDSRHPFKPEDVNLINWAVESEVFCHVLLSKADKLTHQNKIKTLKMAQEHIQSAGVDDLVSVQLFSSSKKTGLKDLIYKLGQWYSKSE